MALSAYILSIDQGTTGSRALIVDKKGFVKAKSYSEFPQYFPQPGWVEHDPAQILRTTLSVVKNALSDARISSRQIAAIGITNQRETTVVWDPSSGKPLCRAIVWQDRRTSDLCEQLKKRKLEPLIHQKTGLVLDPYFSASKLKWIFQNVAGSRSKAVRGKALFGTIDTWLLWNLTGGKSHATDFSNASRTLLFDIEKKKWDPELLKIFNVPQTCLPKVQASASLFGRTARLGPFTEGIPIYGMIGDQQSALYGQGCYEPGSSKNTYGTGCFAVLNTGHRKVVSHKGLLTTLACDREGQPVYALEGAVFIAGAVVQWLRDGLQLIKAAAETEPIARAAKDTGGVYVVPAFVGLGAPYWDSRARGAIVGITRGTGRKEIIKAALDSIAYQTVDILSTMKSESRLEIKELRVDGGATQNAYLMQRQADLLEMKVKRTSIAESTAWGAAKLAGKGAGFWSDLRQVDQAIRYRTFTPKMASKERKILYDGWKSSVAQVLTRP